jgi:hypothetical protein
MRRSLLVRGTLPLIVVAALSDAAVGSADPYNPTDDERASARLLGTAGVELAMSGDCARAVDKLARAEGLVHAPTTAVPLAQCQIQLGKIITGTELLIRVLNETLPASAPPSWIEARKRAQSALDAAEPRIAKVRIHVDGPAGFAQGLQVTVDGEPLPLLLLDNDRPTDPGVHHITAKQAGSTQADVDVSLSDGQTKSVTLKLEPLGQGAVAAAPPPRAADATVSGVDATRSTAGISETPPTGETPAPGGASATPGLVALGIGGAGVVAGVVFGILALSTKSSLDAECSGTICPAQAQSDIDALRTDAIVSTVGWGIGAAGAVVGTILLLTRRPVASPKSARVDVRPWLGPASLGLSGSFR